MAEPQTPVAQVQTPKPEPKPPVPAPAAKAPVSAASVKPQTQTPPREERKEKKREIVLERLYVANLSKAYAKPFTKRGNTAMRLLRAFCSRHMKTAEEAVRIDPSVADFVRKRGMKHPARRVKIKLSKDKAGIVLCELAESVPIKPKREKPVKAPKQAAPAKSEAKPAAKALVAAPKPAEKPKQAVAVAAKS